MAIVQAAIVHALWPVVVVASLVTLELGRRLGYEPAAVLLAVNAATLGAVLVAEQMAPLRREWSPLTDAQSVNDLGHGVLQSLLGERIGGLVLVAAVTASVATGARGAVWPVEWPMAMQVLLGVVAADGLDYWKHRALHTDLGWRFHALHHGIDRLHALRAARSHFGEVALRFLVVYAPLVVIGAPPAVLVWHAALIGTLGVIGHANVRLRLPSCVHRLVVTPHVHRLHHSDERALSDTNFSNILPLWDALFGTFSHPEAHALRRVGVMDGDVPAGFVRQLAAPFSSRPKPTVAGDDRATSRA